MKRLKILQTQSDFETQYPDGIPSNDVVLVKENDKLYMATNNADGTYAEYGATGGGEITPEIIEELGLVTVDDISAFVKNGTVGNLYIGSDSSTTGSSLVIVRQFQGQVSETKLSNVDNRSALVNRVGSIDNARLILSHEGLLVGFSGDKDTSFPAQSKHVAFIEDTSANFALKSQLDGFVDSQDISAFLKPNDVSNYALKSELEGLVNSNDISAFLKPNDVSNKLQANDISTFIDEDYLTTNGYITDQYLNDGGYITEQYMADHDAGWAEMIGGEVSAMIDFDPEDPFLKQSEFDLSDYPTFTDLQAEGYLKPNDVSNHALKADLNYIVWQGTQAQYDALVNHTDYKIYLITA